MEKTLKKDIRDGGFHRLIHSRVWTQEQLQVQSDVDVQEAPASTISRRLSYYSVLTRFPLPTHMHFFDIYMYGIHAVPRLQLRDDTRTPTLKTATRTCRPHAGAMYAHACGYDGARVFSCVFPRCWLPAIHRSPLWRRRAPLLVKGHDRIQELSGRASG